MQVQIARPMSDDQTDNWTPKPLAQQINGVRPNDNAPIASPVNPSGNLCEMKLQSLAWPSAGTETLTARLAGDGATPVTVALLQGSNVIASATFTPGPTFIDYDLTLTPTQVAQISDYTNLHVALIANGTLVSCCDQPMPLSLTATFSNGQNTCDCLDGVTVPLDWNAALGGWSGSTSASACGGELNFLVSCQSGNWFLQNTGGSCAVTNTTLTGTCGINQTQLTGTTQVTQCCTGRVTITVTG